MSLFKRRSRTPQNALESAELPYRADWTEAARTTLGVASAGVFLLWVIGLLVSFITSRGSRPDGGFDLVNVWILFGEWGRAGAAHMDWTAPALLTAIGFLATLPGLIGRAEPGDSETTQRVVTFFAHLLGGAFIVWLLLVVAGLTASPAQTVAVDTSSVAEQRDTIAGLFIVAPVGVFIGLVAGRFLLPPIAKRVKTAEAELGRLDAEIAEMAQKAYILWGRQKVRATLVLTQGLPILMLIAAVALLCLAAETTPRVTFVLCLLTALTSAIFAVGTVHIRITLDQPIGVFWRAEGAKRRPRIVAVTVLALASLLALAGAVLPLSGILWSLFIGPIPAPLSAISWWMLTALALQSALTFITPGGRNAWATAVWLNRRAWRATAERRLEKLRAEQDAERLEAR